MNKTKISWTNETWNPVVGCSRVSEGCRHCYAERMDKRIRAVRGEQWKEWSAQNAAYNVRLHPERLQQPLHWKQPRMVFVNSMSDLFHENVPFEFIGKVFYTMSAASKHTFQVLTKRPQRMLEYYEWMRNTSTSKGYLDESDFPNVWLGVSVENQKAADERIPLLLRTPAAVRFLSCEPLLGEIDLTRWMGGDNEIKKQRSGSVQGSNEWRIGNRPTGKNLEISESPGQPMARGNTFDSMRETPRGTQYGRVSSSQGNGELETNGGVSASLGLVSPQRSDSRRIDSESQEREQDRQSPREFGIGDLFGTDKARDFGSGASSQAKPLGAISWVICGGESGPHFREMNLDWARSIKDQCVAANIPFWFKQGSAYRSEQNTFLDGREWREFPNVV